MDLHLLHEPHEEEEESNTTTTTTKNQENENDNEKSTQKPALFLFLFNELTGKTTHAVLDPHTQETHLVDFPELNFSMQLLYAAHGWFLLLSREKKSLFFFNPSTRKRIGLPYRKRIFDAAVFSEPPTSPNCIVFALDKQGVEDYLHIDVLHVGEPRWTEGSHDGKGFTGLVQAVYTGGLVYFTDTLGRIGAYNVKETTWTELSVSKKLFVKDSYLVGIGRELFAGKKVGYGGLKKISAKDGEMEDMIAGVFLGPYGSCSYGWSSEEDAEKENMMVFVAGDKPDMRCSVYKDIDFKDKMALAPPELGFQYTPVWIELSNLFWEEVFDPVPF